MNETPSGFKKASPEIEVGSKWVPKPNAPDLVVVCDYIIITNIVNNNVYYSKHFLNPRSVPSSQSRSWFLRNYSPDNSSEYIL